MQAEEIEDAFDLTEEEILEEEQQEEEEEEKEEEKPKPSGYMTKEAWIASGKDPDEWVTEDVFKERTLRIKNESRLKRELAEREKEFDNRIRNLNALTQSQIKRLEAQLQAQRDEAIEVGDKAAVKSLDRQIHEVQEEAKLLDEPKAVDQRDPAIIEWEAENPWVNDLEDPRRPIAIEAFTKAQNAGKSLAMCLIAADKSVSGYEPERQEKRKMPQMADSSKSTISSKSDSPTLTWSQLKNDEITLYEELFEPEGMSKKDFLKTVADQRRGA